MVLDIALGILIGFILSYVAYLIWSSFIDLLYMAMTDHVDTKQAENANTCVCCGAIIPEGRQVCPKCEKIIDEINKHPN